MSGANNSGIPLMPSVARPLILRLFEQQNQWRRSDLAQKVEELHLAEGGSKGTQNPQEVVKKALGELFHDGVVAKAAPGFWRSSASSAAPDLTPENNPEVLKALDDSDGDDDYFDDEKNQIAEEVVGLGGESVYLYFNPNERKLAQVEGRPVWPCKIGRCFGDPTVRILTQGVKTAFSSAPVIGLVIKTTESVYLEKALHTSLRLAGAEVPESLGTEWFNTSPTKVRGWWDGYSSALRALGS